MKTMMTTEVFRAAEVFVASMSTDVGPGLLDREVTGGCSVRSAGTLAGPTTGEHEIVATNIEVNNIEVKNFMGVVRLSGFSDADQTKQRADRFAGTGRLRHGIRVS